MLNLSPQVFERWCIYANYNANILFWLKHLYLVFKLIQNTVDRWIFINIAFNLHIIIMSLFSLLNLYIDNLCNQVIKQHWFPLILRFWIVQSLSLLRCLLVWKINKSFPIRPGQLSWEKWKRIKFKQLISKRYGKQKVQIKNKIRHKVVGGGEIIKHNKKLVSDLIVGFVAVA